MPAIGEPVASGPSLYSKVLVGFLYFLQGVYLVIPSTITLTYKAMPSYSILSLFSMALLPFSFKFVAAPLIQKYTLSAYGRRKTWLIVSLTISSLLLILAANLTDEIPKIQGYLALCLFAAIFMIALEDISTDALSVKELDSAELASYMQCVMQPIGAVFGSLFFLQLVSGSLYLKLGLQQPLLSTAQYFCLLAGLTLTAAFVIHLTYNQKVNDEQRESAESSLLDVIKHYRYFFHPRYRLCRQGITFLLQAHGIIYFSSSFTVQLIKQDIIAKDSLTTLSNLMVIPVFLVTSWLRGHWNDLGLIHTRTRLMLALRLCLIVFLYMSGIQNPTALYLLICVLSLLSNVQFFLNSMICNNFTESKYAGMYVTMMASFTNFGNNSTIQLEAISVFGYHPAVIFGLLYTAAMVLAFGKVQAWIKRGKSEHQGSIEAIRGKAQ